MHQKSNSYETITGVKNDKLQPSLVLDVSLRFFPRERHSKAVLIFINSYKIPIRYKVLFYDIYRRPTKL